MTAYRDYGGTCAQNLITQDGHTEHLGHVGVGRFAGDPLREWQIVRLDIARPDGRRVAFVDLLPGDARELAEAILRAANQEAESR